MNTVLFHIDGHIATITINKPQVLNALSTEVLTDLKQVLDEIEKIENLKINLDYSKFDYKDIKEIRNYDFEIEEKIHIYGKDLVIKLSPSKNNWLFGK